MAMSALPLLGRGRGESRPGGPGFPTMSGPDDPEPRMSCSGSPIFGYAVYGLVGVARGARPAMLSTLWCRRTPSAVSSGDVRAGLRRDDPDPGGHRLHRGGSRDHAQPASVRLTRSRGDTGVPGALPSVLPERALGDHRTGRARCGAHRLCPGGIAQQPDQAGVRLLPVLLAPLALVMLGCSSTPAPGSSIRARSAGPSPILPSTGSPAIT